MTPASFRLAEVPAELKELKDGLVGCQVFVTVGSSSWSLEVGSREKGYVAEALQRVRFCSAVLQGYSSPC